MDRGGKITWIIDADDSAFTRTMEKVRAESALAAKDVDKHVEAIDVKNRVATKRISSYWSESVTKSRGALQDFWKELGSAASHFRSFDIAFRGFNYTSLIAGVVAATAAIIELGSAVVAAGGTLVTLPSIIATFVGAMGVAKTALYGLEDAMDAIVKGDAEDLAEALAKLSPNAQKFVTTVNDLKGNFKELQLDVQNAAFANMDKVLSGLVANTLPVVRKGFVDIAGALNGVVTEAGRVAQEPFFKAALAESLDTTAQATTRLQKAVEPAIQSVAGLLKVGNPFVLMLSDWVVRQVSLAEAFINSSEGQQKLTNAVNIGIEALKQLGDLTNSVFGLLATLFKTSQNSGFSLIETLTGIIDRMNNFLQTAEGQKQFIAVMENTRDTVIAVSEVLGTVAKVLLTIAEAFNGLPGPVKDVVTQFLAWTLVLTPVITYVASLSASVRVLTGLIGVLFEAIGAKQAFSLFIQGFKDSRIAASAFSGIFGTLGGAVRTGLTAIGTAATSVLSGILPAAAAAGRIALVALGTAIRAIPVVGWIITAITLLVGLFSYLYTNVEGFRNFVNGVGQFFVEVWGRVTSFFTSTVGPGLTGVFDGFIIGLQVVGNFFKTIWDGIVSIAGTVVGRIVKFFEPLTPLFQGIAYVVKAMASIIITVFSGIAQVLGVVSSFIVQAIGIILYGTIMTVWKNVLIPFGNFFVGLWNDLMNVVNVSVTAIQSVITVVWNSIVGFLTPIVQSLISMIISNFDLLKSGISTVLNFISGISMAVWGAISAFLQPIISALVSYITGQFNILSFAVQVAFGYIRDNIINPISAVINFVTSRISVIVGSINSAVSAAVGVVVGFAGRMVSAGRDFIDGLVRGIQNGKDAVVNKVKEIASGALDSLKKFFGIKSPSRVMAQMGDYMMQGLQNGILKTGEKVVSSTQSIATDIASAFGNISGQNITASVSPTLTDVNGFANISASYSNDALLGNTASEPVTINQTNNVYTDVDMNQVNRDLTWELNKL